MPANVSPRFFAAAQKNYLGICQSLLKHGEKNSDAQYFLNLFWFSAQVILKEERARILVLLNQIKSRADHSQRELINLYRVAILNDEERSKAASLYAASYQALCYDGSDNDYQQQVNQVLAQLSHAAPLATPAGEISEKICQYRTIFGKDGVIIIRRLKEKCVQTELKGEIPASGENLICVVIQHVEAQRQLDVRQPIMITRAPHAEYVQAVMLYCKSQNYQVINCTGFKRIGEKIAHRDVRSFKDKIEKSPFTYGYYNRRQLLDTLDTLEAQLSPNQPRPGVGAAA